MNSIHVSMCSGCLNTMHTHYLVSCVYAPPLLAIKYYIKKTVYTCSDNIIMLIFVVTSLSLVSILPIRPVSWNISSLQNFIPWIVYPRV